MEKHAGGYTFWRFGVLPSIVGLFKAVVFFCLQQIMATDCDFLADDNLDAAEETAAYNALKNRFIRLKTAFKEKDVRFLHRSWDICTDHFV